MRLLILCTGNSCRSQMAEALLRSFDPRLDVQSAGTAPARDTHPLALRVLRELGIEHHGTPKHVESFLGEAFDYIITVCDHANETCPLFTGPAAHRLHIGFEDPAAASGSQDEIIAIFRRVRDQIRSRFFSFYESTLLPQLTP